MLASNATGSICVIGVIRVRQWQFRRLRASRDRDNGKDETRGRFDGRIAFLRYIELELVVKSCRVVTSRWLVVPAIIVCSALFACSDDPVAPSPVPEHAVAVTYCAGAAPTWVAFRDAEWTLDP